MIAALAVLWFCLASTVATAANATLGVVPGDFVVERGYAPSPLGQIHFQDVRPPRLDASQPVYVLLHQVPWFHIYYNGAQAELARRGAQIGRAHV